MARHRRGYTGEHVSELLGVKLTPSQMAQLRDRASASGLPVSMLARTRLTGGRLPKPGADPVTLRAVMAEINRLGNNVNQLARIANQTGRIRSEAALEAVTVQIIDTLRKVVGR